jgi:hypothetical protein
MKGHERPMLFILDTPADPFDEKKFGTMLPPPDEPPPPLFVGGVDVAGSVGVVVVAAAFTTTSRVVDAVRPFVVSVTV